MNFDDIKQFIANSGEKVVFLENGKPSFVLLNFEDYKRMIDGKKFYSDSTMALPSFMEKEQLTREMKPVSELIAERQSHNTENVDDEIDLDFEKDFSIDEPEMPAKELTLEDLPF